MDTMRETAAPNPQLARKFNKGSIVWGKLGGYIYVFEVANVQVDEKGFVWLKPAVGNTFRIDEKFISLGHVDGYLLTNVSSLAHLAANSVSLLRDSCGVDRVGLTADEVALLKQLDDFGV